MTDKKSYWLLKTEPTSYSIDDLAAEPDRTTCWDGVRNYQARNLMRDQMRVGDEALFYHSNAKPPAVVGTVVITRPAYPDASAWDPKSKYFDDKSSPNSPRWFMVDVRLKRQFPEPVDLARLRDEPVLAEMELLRKGSRLSVQPVRKTEFETILAISKRKPSSVT